MRGWPKPSAEQASKEQAQRYDLAGKVLTYRRLYSNDSGLYRGLLTPYIGDNFPGPFAMDEHAFMNGFQRLLGVWSLAALGIFAAVYVYSYIRICI